MTDAYEKEEYGYHVFGYYIHVITNTNQIIVGRFYLLRYLCLG